MPSARMGHVAVVVDARRSWGEELLVVHGDAPINQTDLGPRCIKLWPHLNLHQCKAASHVVSGIKVTNPMYLSSSSWSILTHITQRQL